MTLSSIAFAVALVMGPSGVEGDVGTPMGMSEGCSASSPLPWERSNLGSKSSSPCMVGCKILDAEDIAHVVLVAREVDLVSVVVVACKHLEGSIRSWTKLGFAFLWEAVLAKV